MQLRELKLWWRIFDGRCMNIYWFMDVAHSIVIQLQNKTLCMNDIVTHMHINNMIAHSDEYGITER